MTRTQVQEDGRQGRSGVPDETCPIHRPELDRIGRREARRAVEIAGAEIANECVDIGVETELDTREVRQRPRGAEGRRGRRERVRGRSGRRARAPGLQDDLGRDEGGGRRRQIGHSERTRADRPPAERVLGEGCDRHLPEQVGRRDRLGQRLQEPAERGLEREPHLARAGRRDRHLGPRCGGRSRVGRVLQRLDREDHVIGRDRRAVVPARVRAQVDRPGLARRIDRPALGQVGHERAARPVAHESGEDQRDQVAIGLGLGGQRGDGRGCADHALDVRADLETWAGRDRRSGRGRWRRGELDGGDADECGEDRKKCDERPDDDGVGPGHEAPCDGRGVEPQRDVRRRSSATGCTTPGRR